jgi:peptidoglycan hydrolase CwlO-like protein
MNNNNVSVPKIIIWMVISLLFLGPLSWVCANQYSQGFEMVRQEEKIKSVTRRLERIENKIDNILDIVKERDGG